MNRVFVVCFVLLLSSYQYVCAMEMQDLLKKIANTPVKFAHFTETRTAYFLEQPVVSKGTLEFNAPATLIKRILEPEYIVQHIEGDLLSITQANDSKQTISLQYHPELGIGINAIRWLLSGNVSAINQNFNASFNSIEHQWSIALIPKDADIAVNIASILITGEDDHITQINIKQVNGDSIKTVLYDHR